MYGIIEIGSKYTESYQVYITRDDAIVSPFHDVHPYNPFSINVVNEIPRFENAKFEVSKSDKMNPIKQDKKKNVMRFVSNIFPYKGYPWNYGMIPQTYEDPKILDEDCKAYGDNDPLDVIEIGSAKKYVGEVYQAKVLGCICLLDGGESDWKIIVLDCEDEMAKEVNDIADVEKFFPGLLDATKVWFRDYKIPDGKDQNVFGLNGEYKDKEYAMEVINRGHQQWKKMILGESDICKVNSTLIDSGHKCDKFVVEGVQEESAEVPEKCFSYFHIKK